MLTTWFAGKRVLCSAVLAGSLMAIPGFIVVLGARAQAAPAASGQDAQLQTDVMKALNNKHLRGVTATVDNGTVTLAGSVPTYRDKQDANKKTLKVHGVGSVKNQIQVAGPDVSDEVLAQKLANKLAINDQNADRTAFQIINPSVQNGVVTLTGLVTQPIDKDDAEGIVADYPGVKDIVNHIQVAPLSPADDRVRRAVYQAIYGYPTFTRYGINPVKPIRILVVNGNVTLVGGVDSQTDKEQAYLRANGVGGVFKVTNDLQVAGQRSEQ